MEEFIHIMVDRKQIGGMGPRTRHNLQGHTPSDLLPSTRPHLLKFPDPPKIACQLGDHTFNT
jgi:hypothetical protein